jgi:hypothetical protein
MPKAEGHLIHQWFLHNASKRSMFNKIKFYQETQRSRSGITCDQARNINSRPVAKKRPWPQDWRSLWQYQRDREYETHGFIPAFLHESTKHHYRSRHSLQEKRFIQKKCCERSGILPTRSTLTPIPKDARDNPKKTQETTTLAKSCRLARMPNRQWPLHCQREPYQRGSQRSKVWTSLQDGYLRLLMA